jgi:ribosome maturation factor RimP
LVVERGGQKSPFLLIKEESMKDMIVKLKDFVTEITKDSDLYLFDVKESKGKIIIFIDGDRSVNIGDCSMIMKKIRKNFEGELDNIEITVSSLGVTYPLTLPRQYNKNIGKTITAYLNDGKNEEGKLLEVLEDKIILQTPKKEIKELMFNQIKQSKVQLKF